MVLAVVADNACVLNEYGNNNNGSKANGVLEDNAEKDKLELESLVDRFFNFRRCFRLKRNPLLKLLDETFGVHFCIFESKYDDVLSGVNKLEFGESKPSAQALGWAGMLVSCV